MASLKWSADALRDLENIDAVIARRILEKTSWFESHFSEIVPEKLHHDLKQFYKLRVGDYRVVYEIRGSLIIINAVGHRKDIYS